MSLYNYVIFPNYNHLFTLRALLWFLSCASFSCSHKLRATMTLIWVNNFTLSNTHPEIFPFRVLIVRVLVSNHSACRPRTAEAINYSLWETKPALEGEKTLANGRYVQNHCEGSIVVIVGQLSVKYFFVPSSPAVSCVWRSGRRIEKEIEESRDHPKLIAPVSWFHTHYLWFENVNVENSKWGGYYQ